MQKKRETILRRAVADALEPPPDLTVSEWADEKRVLSREASAKAGKWRSVGFQRGMMDVFNDPAVTTIVSMLCTQVGKTEYLLNVIGYHMDFDPCPMIALQPTLDMGQAFSKDRLATMIRDTPCLSKKVRDARARDSNNTLLHKGFAGGHVTIAGANSPASLASRPVRLALCDEVDRYPVSAGTEGDPVSLVVERTDTFWNRKVLLVSTPTIKGESRIEAEFELSDKRYYFVPCPHCGHMQTLKWASLIFDKEEIEKPIVYVCENGCVIEEKHKLQMIDAGEWRATAPMVNGRAGFHLNKLYSPWAPWRRIVTKFLEAKGDPQRLKTWTNTTLAETFEIRGAAIGDENLIERCEMFDGEVIPDEILFLTGAVDTQDDRLEAQMFGWGENKERWAFPVKVIWGDPGKPSVWQELDDWLKTTWYGYQKLKIAWCFVDSGGHHTNSVYTFCKARQSRRVFAAKGSSQYGAPLVHGPKQIGTKRVSLYLIGTTAAKDAIKSALTVEEEGPGFIHFSHGCDEEYFKQLTKSEVRKVKRLQGSIVPYYEQKRDRNEGLDLAVLNEAAYAALNPDIQKIKAKRAPKPEAPPPPKSTTLMRSRPSKRGRGNFVKGL